MSRLPDFVRELFWDSDPEQLRFEEHRTAVVDRVLSDGSWDAIQWLRDRVGLEGIREHVVRTQGRRLSPRQLRFWQLILDLPGEDVDAWLASPARRIWDRRAG